MQTPVEQNTCRAVEQARQVCADDGSGEFALEWGAVTGTELDGDLRLDRELDESA
jgi:hypothetical protein